MGIFRVGIINDVHYPVQDQRAVDLVLDIFEDQGIDWLIIAGDFEDFVNVSSHGPKDPDIVETLSDEIAAAREGLELCRKKLPNARITYMAGNHTVRLERFIMTHARPFWNMFDLKIEYGLERLNIEWHPYNEPFWIVPERLYVQHSPPSYGVSGSMTSLQKRPGATGIFGCTHRMQQSHMTDVNGVYHSVFFNGWLGSATISENHKRYFKYAKNHQNWQQGFAIATVEEGGEFFVNQHLIKNYKTVVGDTLYEG